MKEITIDSLGYLLDRALWTMINSLNTTLKERNIDLSYSQYIILRILYEKDGLSQSEIAMQLHKDASAVKRGIDYLEAKDFVIRKPVSGCKYNIFLTDKGKRMEHEIVAAAEKMIKDATGDIPEEMYCDGIEFLQRIYKSSFRA